MAHLLFLKGCKRLVYVIVQILSQESSCNWSDSSDKLKLNYENENCKSVNVQMLEALFSEMSIEHPIQSEVSFQTSSNTTSFSPQACACSCSLGLQRVANQVE